jgi:hypothetical protein
MHLHGNARTTPYTRQLMVRRVLKRAEPVKDTADSSGVSSRGLYGAGFRSSSVLSVAESHLRKSP